ncbi:uncharacterized protein LOC113358877 [Papaver somniferum]|uniref:uncharacterized protein LOC113350578 n=1 Tax=Papaver somniferum TaxID=3469 RepID=UPI000E6F81C6|nr:uncharacterized protein LOC113350578 [Papaver somniferum]XP_026458383.1 uncharacterized protein LOC113358877 [Papaver somniferum]
MTNIADNTILSVYCIYRIGRYYRHKNRFAISGFPYRSVSDTADRIVGDGSAKAGAKRKKVERTERSGELKSSTGISEPVVELENLDHYKTKCIELSVELEKKELELEKIKVEKKVELEKKELELEKMIVELEKKKVEKVPNVYDVEEGKDWGCLEERASQHGSSSQKLSGEPEDSNNFVYSKTSLDDPMDYKDEMEWISEHELLSSFEEDPELCMKAVCALYRQKISEAEISAGLYYHSDILSDSALACSMRKNSWTTLAKFIMGEDCKGDVQKSVKELETLDPKAVNDCKRLARRYSIHIFDIYQNGKDPFFHPARTASHGEQTAK